MKKMADAEVKCSGIDFYYSYRWIIEKLNIEYDIYIEYWIS